MRKLLLIFTFFIVLTLSSCSVKELFRKYNVVNDLDQSNTSLCSHLNSSLIETEEANCINDGYKLLHCNDCNTDFKIPIVALGHTYGDFSVTKEATTIEAGEKKHTCSVCDYVEFVTIPATSTDFDVSAFTFDYKSDTNYVYKANSIDDVKLIFDAMVLRNASNVIINVSSVEYDFTKSEEVCTMLKNNCKYLMTRFSFTYSYTKFRDKVTKIEFKDCEYTNTLADPLLAGVYNQYNSINYANSSTRLSSFSNFKINDSMYSLDNVTTSTQLFYCLQYGVKPNCVANSQAEKVYTALKNILINNVDTTDSDDVKLRKIHDYLIMNVAYDYALSSLADSDKPDDYNQIPGFFVEGCIQSKLSQSGLDKAVCQGFALAYTCLCNIEGIKCVYVSGDAKDTTKAGHAWNKVYYNGNWYVVDVTSDNPLINDTFEALSYDNFLITETKLNSLYNPKQFTSLVCNTNLNYYSNMHFTYNSTEYNYCLTSSNLDSFSGYIASQFNLKGSNTTISFYCDNNQLKNNLLTTLSYVYHYNNLGLSTLSDNIYLLVY